MSRRVIWHTPEPCSGAARYPREMLSALTAEGIPVHFICPENYRFREELRRNPLITMHLTRARSVDFRRGIFAKAWTNGRFLLSSASALLGTVRRGDIVHFQHTLHFPFSALFFLGARLRGGRVIFTVHDPVPHKWFLPPRLRWIERRSMLWALRVSDVLIVHSEPGKRALIAQYGISEEKVRVIARGPYGLGQGLLPMPASDRLELLLFGSIRENKGVHLAIEAVQALYREGAAVRLTIAGDVVSVGEAGYWERCRDLIARSPEPIQVRRGFIDDEMLPELFRNCHCLLLPYTHFFSDSGVAYMALANGRPILSTQAGGLGPLLDSAQLGLTIHTATVPGVKAAIAAALELGVGELAKLGQSGAEYVNHELAWPKVARKTAEVYARCGLPIKEGMGAERKAIPARVILHTPEPESGSARYVWELVRALTLEGLPVDLVCPENFRFRPDLEAISKVTLHLSSKRCTSNKRTAFTRIRQNLVFVVSSLAELLRTCRRGDPVHFQYPLHFPLGLLFLWSARLCGCKVIYTVHDPLPHRWLLPLPLRWLEKAALKYAYNISHRLIVHSEAGKRTLTGHFHQDPGKISIVAHGPFDLGEGLLPMPRSTVLNLLLFGAIRENKGVHLAIQAVQALHSQSEPVRLTIAGAVILGKEQPYWDECLRLISENPEPIRVMQEFVPDQQLPQLFGECHCVLLPYTEFFSDSGVAQMALANGRPILATRSGGLGAILDAAEVGIPIEDVSRDGVVQAIRAALQLGTEELERLGRNGLRLANRQGGWQRVAAETLEVYERTLSSGQSPAPNPARHLRKHPGAPAPNLAELTRPKE